MSKINIVIPMAGAGSRFQIAGYDLPKPFIDINGKMMIENVLEGLKYPDASYTLIIQEEFNEKNKTELKNLKQNFPAISFITVEKLTQGASCTALAAHSVINNDTPVLFADSDNIFKPEILKSFIDDAIKRDLDGSLLSFETKEACFSFIEINKEGFGIKTREKEAISSHAIAGVYYFKKGSDFVKNAIDMMIYNDRSKGEFYMSNVYNYLIKNGGKIGIYTIQDSDWDCVGTPEQLNKYLGR